MAPATRSGLRRRERLEPLAEGAVADLVVVLQEVDEGVGGRCALGSPRGAPPR